MSSRGFSTEPAGFRRDDGTRRKAFKIEELRDLGIWETLIVLIPESLNS
jgi:hypothetical protein